MPCTPPGLPCASPRPLAGCPWRLPAGWSLADGPGKSMLLPQKRHGGGAIWGLSAHGDSPAGRCKTDDRRIGRSQARLAPAVRPDAALLKCQENDVRLRYGFERAGRKALRLSMRLRQGGC